MKVHVSTQVLLNITFDREFDDDTQLSVVADEMRQAAIFEGQLRLAEAFDEHGHTQLIIPHDQT